MTNLEALISNTPKRFLKSEDFMILQANEGFFWILCFESCDFK